MGSMLEIMKQVREDSGAPASPAVEGIVEPMLEDAAGNAPAAAALPSSRFTQLPPAAPEEPPKFEPVEMAAQIPSIPVPETQEWDSRSVDSAVVAVHARYSIECEQFRSIRARLLSMNGAANRCMLAVTSSLPGEGKSSCTMNLGLVMAEGGEQRTLIVDADFRRASITSMLGMQEQPGLADLIRDPGSLRTMLAATPFPNLKLLPAGTQSPGGPCDLFGSSNLRQVFTELRDAFDYIFVDMPPVSTVSDASALAPLCDAALLVLEMRRTPEAVAQEAVRTLQANNVRVVGCIVTRHSDRPSRAYGANYDYYRRS